MDIPQQNTGILLGSGTKALWVGGTIPYEEVLPSGDWRPFLPKTEKQKNPNETMACVSFSCLNILETLSKQQTGIEPNYSDRFIAKLSGTTLQGNHLDKVADTVRKIGVVKEEVWPAPAGLSWAQYYSEIPQEVINKAEKVDIAYENIGGNLNVIKHHLKQSPIQIILTATRPRHAVLLAAIEGNNAWYFDTYGPHLKKIKASNIYNYALKIVLNINKPAMQLVNDNGTVYVVTGNEDKRKIGIADVESLGLFGDEPQVSMDTSTIPEYNTIVEAKKITHK